ncbi:hypothetical protein TYRP_010208 [Tyrophagus putrescentiae]|nr:hypothetical protein TYRP_010208 [Tyrophagus putrescentiae]
MEGDHNNTDDNRSNLGNHQDQDQQHQPSPAPTTNEVMPLSNLGTMNHLSPSLPVPQPQRSPQNDQIDTQSLTMEDDDVKDQIISYHIGNSVNGLKALSGNRNLVQSVQKTQPKENFISPRRQTLRGKFGKLMFPFSNPSNCANSTFSIIDQIEQARVKSKRRLEVAVKELCEQSAKMLEALTEKNRQKAQQKLANLNTETERFYQFINRLNRAAQLDTDFVPTAIYIPSMLKVLSTTAEMQLETERVNSAEYCYERRTLAAVIEEKENEKNEEDEFDPVQHLSSSTNPEYVKELLAKIGDRLTPLQNYAFIANGDFGSGSQGTVHQATRLEASKKGSTTIVLKVYLITACSFWEVITEVTFIAKSETVLRHPNILTPVDVHFLSQK